MQSFVHTLSVLSLNLNLPSHQKGDKFRHLDHPLFVSSILPSLLELLQELLSFEVLRDGLVVAGDHLVDLLLPAALGVLAVAHRHEEFPQCCLHHRQKVVGHL